MVEFADWQSWLVPVILLLLVYTAFQTQIQSLIDGMATWASNTFQVNSLQFKPVAFSIIIILVLLVGVSLAIYLNGTEPLNWRNIYARLSVIVVLFFMAWIVNMVNAIFVV